MRRIIILKTHNSGSSDSAVEIYIQDKISKSVSALWSTLELAELRMKTWDLLKCEQGQGFGTVFLVRWHTSEEKKKKRRICHWLCIQCLV